MGVGVGEVFFRTLVFQKKFFRDYSHQIILASFLLIIALGTWFLRLEVCSPKGISFFQAFFTATSATCVTGLSIYEIENFSRIGQLVIMILIQIGGLGLMTLSLFLVAMIYRELGVGSTFLAKDFLNLSSFGRVKDLLRLIMKITFGTEIIGAIVLFFRFINIYPYSKAIFYAIFYSISAFCNAGVSLHSNSLESMRNDSIIMATIQVLTLIGGFGFLVFYELINLVKKLWANFYYNKVHAPVPMLSLHSRIVIRSSIVLTVVGTLFFLAIEKNKIFRTMSWGHALLESLFHNIALRSSGFTIFNVVGLSDASLLLSMAFMMVGASPGSTGGGMKITTFTIFIATLVSLIRGKTYVEIGKRTISEQQIYKSMSILSLTMMWIFSSTFLLLLIESQHSFVELFFESCSSLSNVGMSTGITPSLSFIAQCILIVNMIAGRIGILTFVFAIRQRYAKQLYRYPGEEIILG